MNTIDFEDLTAVEIMLNKICGWCRSRNCPECEITNMRLRIHISERDTDLLYSDFLPEWFYFKSNVNHLTSEKTYYAQWQENSYAIYLTKIGEVCRLSAKQMMQCITQGRFVLLKGKE